MTTRVTIHGAAGRMGRRLVALAAEDEQFALAGAMDAAGHPLLGQDAGTVAGVGELGVRIADTLPEDDAGVVIDFSLPAAMRPLLDACGRRGLPLVIGTTGLTGDDHARIDKLAADVAVLQAPNMSLGVNLLFALAGQVAGRLGDDYDIEITETHHRFKKDAPSGTALGLAAAICKVTGKSMADDVVCERHGDDVPRRRGEIGMHALRSGDVVGRHTASFATLGEELQLTHIATSRDVFARGALRAAAWLAGKPTGRYDMAAVLGL